MKSCDVGSLPLVVSAELLLRGAKQYAFSTADSAVNFFEEKVVNSFVDKLKAGVDVPNYPQFRDMNEMFFEMIGGVEGVGGRYLETNPLSVQAGKRQIPEVLVIRRNSQHISEKIGGSFEVKVCITGPYTLSSFFNYRDHGMFNRLAGVLSAILESNMYSDKHSKVSLVALDEPVFGILDDPLLDFGSEGRESLLKAWNSIFTKARSNKVQTLLHLHNTSDHLFWDTQHLQIIDSHVGSPLYESGETRRKLETTDKLLKASISVSDFDTLIRNRLIASPRQKLTESKLNEEVAAVWKAINDRTLDPAVFLEERSSITKRLDTIVRRFGVERVPYAGPECGFASHPTYQCAIAYLKRISTVINRFTNNP